MNWKVENQMLLFVPSAFFSFVFAFPLIVLFDLVSIICFDQQCVRGGKEEWKWEGQSGSLVGECT